MVERSISDPVSISVVVCTYNRGFILKDCIAALFAQDYNNYNIIIVCGPCTDDTEAFLKTQLDIEVINTSVRNLSISRNLGIEHSSAEVIAFIDDDGIAMPNWLSMLAKAYEDPGVGGAGGLVYDHTGMTHQYRYSACFRNGRTAFSEKPFGAECVRPGANPFIYIQGTNASFRRSVLAEVGGFNERIEYYHDETDVCRRILDAGHKLIALEGAIVHHKYAESATRDAKRIVRDPYAIVKNQHQFALHNGPSAYSKEDLLASLFYHTESVEHAGRWHFNNGDFSRAEIANYISRVREGVVAGFDEGLDARPIRTFGRTDSTDFRRLRKEKSTGKHVCFVSSEYPPGRFGGIGRYTYDLATQFVKLGMTVHVVTKSEEAERVDLEQGVWVHRVNCKVGDLAAMSDLPLMHNFALIRRLYEEVLRIHSEFAIDIVNGPIWLSETLLCSLDPRFTCILTLMTTMKTIYDMHPSWSANEDVRMLIELEKQAKTAHEYVHAISNSILEKTDNDYGVSRLSAVMPLGAQPNKVPVSQQKNPNERVIILFVGRLERRKGIDILLQAVVGLIRAGRPVTLRLVGSDTKNTELEGLTYKEKFLNDFGENDDIRKWIHFEGQVSDERLPDFYSEADIFCLPSRFESFGLVLIEAMSYGVPVVAARCGGMAELVEEGINGFLFDPGNSSDLERCLRNLIDDPEQMTAFGKSAKALFDQKYSIDVAARNISTQYCLWSEAHSKPSNLSYTDISNMLKGIARITSSTTSLPDQACFKIARLMFNASIDVDEPTHVMVAANVYLDAADFVAYLYEAVFRRACDWDLSGAEEVLRAAGGRVGYLISLYLSSEYQNRGIRYLARDDKLIWHASLISDRRVNGHIGSTALYVYYLNEMALASDATFGHYLYRTALERDPEFSPSLFSAKIAEAGGRDCYLVSVVTSEEGSTKDLNKTFDVTSFRHSVFSAKVPSEKRAKPSLALWASVIKDALMGLARTRPT